MAFSALWVPAGRSSDQATGRGQAPPAGTRNAINASRAHEPAPYAPVARASAIAGIIRFCHARMCNEVRGPPYEGDSHSPSVVCVVWVAICPMAVCGRPGGRATMLLAKNEESQGSGDGVPGIMHLRVLELELDFAVLDVDVVAGLGIVGRTVCDSPIAKVVDRLVPGTCYMMIFPAPGVRRRGRIPRRWRRSPPRGGRA